VGSNLTGRTFRPSRGGRESRNFPVGSDPAQLEQRDAEHERRLFAGDVVEIQRARVLDREAPERGAVVVVVREVPAPVGEVELGVGVDDEDVALLDAGDPGGLLLVVEQAVEERARRAEPAAPVPGAAVLQDRGARAGIRARS
jgi:hypothetical protein